MAAPGAPTEKKGKDKFAGECAFNKAECEDSTLNQYWYADATIAALVKEIEMHATKAAFLSAPSLYFSLTKDELKKNSKVFEYDRRWGSDPGFVFYDYNAPEAVPASTWEAFDYVVVDPPYITREVWSKYAQTVKLIAAKGAKVLFTSVLENHQMLEEECDMPLYVPAFCPSIPHLTYQYHCFVNYHCSAALQAENPELPAEDAGIRKARELANDMRQSQAEFKLQMKTRDRAGEVKLRPEDEIPAGVDSRLGKELAADPAMKFRHVPDGWTERPDDAAAADAAPESPKSEAYLAAEAQRTDFEAAKKGVEAVVKACEAAVTAKAKLVKEAEGSDKRATHAAAIDAALAAKAAALVELGVVVDRLAKRNAVDAGGVCAALKTGFLADWPWTTAAAVPTPEEYREKCVDVTRKYKSPIFNRQKELLADMKKAKKDAAAATAAGTPAEGAAAAAPAKHADAKTA